MFPAEYTMHTTVASYHAGEGRRLTLSAQLQLQQEVGELQLEAGGLPYSVLWEKGVVFVLTRAAGVRYRTPLFEERLSLTTWSRGPKGAQYHRCYRFVDETGAVVIDAISTFAIVDPHTHRLKRPDEFERLDIRHLPEKENTCPPPPKIHLPQAMERTAQRPVRWSDIDYNGHLNNTVYADFLCDYMPGGMRGREPYAYEIVFGGEALLGETISIRTASEGEDAWFSGTVGDRRCFEAHCKLRAAQDAE